MADRFYLDEIPDWCAGVKVSEVTDQNLKYFNLKEIEEEARRYFNASVLVISLNELEKESLPFLRKLGFKKYGSFKNYNHRDRKTFLMMKQIPKSVANRIDNEERW